MSSQHNERNKPNGPRGPQGHGRFKVTPAAVLWAVLALVGIVLIAQNSASTEVHFFGWTIQAPLFVLIAASMVIGWGLGTLGTQAWSWHRRRGNKS
jgi:uncharacterized integral membrane protein